MSSESPDDDRRPRRSALYLALVVAAVLLVFTHRTIQGQNELSRLAAVDALAVHGTFAIDDVPVARKIVEEDGLRYHYLIDMVVNRRDGRFYSSKPPVYTLLLAVVPAALNRLGAGISLSDGGSPLALMLLTWAFVGGATAGAFYLFRREVGAFIEGREADLVTALALGGTLFLSYSVTINHHTFTAALILAAFFLIGMADGRREPDLRATAAAGALMGLAAVVDIGHGFIFAVAFGLYLLLYQRSWRAALAYGLGAAPLLLLHSIVQFSIWGSILPVQMLEGTKDYALSYWRQPSGPDAWRIPRSRYWFLTLFSMRGLFTLSPVLLFGLAGLLGDLAEAWRAEEGMPSPGLLGRARSGAGRGYAALSVLFGIGFLFWYFSFNAPTNFCGACFGFRWYIGFTPLLGFYAARAYARWRHVRRVRVLFYALGAVSLAYAVVGMRYTWGLMEAIDHPMVEILRPLRGF